MRSLPLFLEAKGFRAVHACWVDPTIDRVRALTDNGFLSEEQLIRAADPSEELFHLAEEITKGSEHKLPEGFAFRDKDGTHRDHVRLQWWNAGARTWRDIAISVPVPDDLPDVPLPGTLMAQTYPAHERPVFFGHYWLNGDPILQAPNALCLDYSAGGRWSHTNCTRMRRCFLQTGFGFTRSLTDPSPQSNTRTSCSSHGKHATKQSSKSLITQGSRRTTSRSRTFGASHAKRRRRLT